MKRFIPIVGIAMFLVCLGSCDEGLKPSDVKSVQDLIHPESGSEKLLDAKLGFFYENDYIAPMFVALKTKEQFDEISRHENAKFLHVAADSANTVDLVTAKAEFEDLKLSERIKAKKDLRYQMLYVNTDPVDAKYSVIEVKSSDEDILNPIMVDPKSWFIELVDKGSAMLTVSVTDGKTTIVREYPMAVIAEVPLMINCDNVWFYGGESVPVQKIYLKYAFPKLPKDMDKLDFLANATAKCYRRCSYRDEPKYGNRWINVVDTVYYGPEKFVESLESEKEKIFMTINGSHFHPHWEWDRHYVEYLDTVKNETVRYLVEQKVPYEIYQVVLYFDETPFNRYFDMDGDIGETNFQVFNVDRRMDSSLEMFYDADYSYVDAYYRRMGQLWNPQKMEHNILELFFNEFLTDEQIDELLNSMSSQFYSHGWSNSQVDSIFNANYEYIQGYRRDN